MVFKVNKFKTVLFFLLFHTTAATCDFLSIVKELLQSGADCSIADNDGFRPADVADSSAIKKLLNTWNQESEDCVCVWSFKSWKSVYLFRLIILRLVLQRIILSISQFKIIFTTKLLHVHMIRNGYLKIATKSKDKCMKS